MCKVQTVINNSQIFVGVAAFCLKKLLILAQYYRVSKVFKRSNYLSTSFSYIKMCFVILTFMTPPQNWSCTPTITLSGIFWNWKRFLMLLQHRQLQPSLLLPLCRHVSDVLQCFKLMYNIWDGVIQSVLRIFTSLQTEASIWKQSVQISGMQRPNLLHLYPS